MLPEFLAFLPSFQGREPIPIGPLATDNLFRFDHNMTIPARAGSTQVAKPGWSIQNRTQYGRTARRILTSPYNKTGRWRRSPKAALTPSHE